MKKCSKCGKKKPLSEFHRHSNRADGLNSWCKDCSKKYRKKYYTDNSEKYTESSKAHRDRVSTFIRRVKKKGQCKCGENRWYVLDFHHLKDKKFSLSVAVSKGYSIENVKTEIKKCELLCANCHRELHYKESL